MLKQIDSLILLVIFEHYFYWSYVYKKIMELLLELESWRNSVPL